MATAPPEARRLVRAAPAVGPLRARLDARPLLLTYLVALAPAVLLAAAQPIWARVDEPQHADVLAQYAHGVYPVEAQTLVRPETLQVMEQTGVFSGDLPGRWPRPHFDPAGPPPGGYARELWMSRHVWQYSYEAMQPPLYYLLATPVWAAAGAAGGALQAAYGARLLDALLAALLAPLTFLLARRLWPAPGLGLAAALLSATLPGFVLNATQVTNDGLAAVLGALAVLLALRGAQEGWSARLAAVTGLVFGLAVMTKLTAAGLAPALALALLLRPARIRNSALAAAAAGACALPWLALNLAVYGAFTPAAAAHRLSAIAPAATPEFFVQSAIHAFVTFWSGEPTFVLPLAQVLCLLAVPLGTLSLAGLRRLASRPDASRLALAVLALAVVGEVVVGLAAPILAQAAFLAPGRYLYPALAPALALFAAGLWAELKAGRAAWAVTEGFTALSLLVLGLYAAGLPQAPARPQAPAGGAPVSAQASYNGVQVSVDQVARDSSGAWVHIDYANTGAAAEWTPVPVVTAGATVVGFGDYAASTPLPGWLEGGSSGSGWIRLNLDHGAPRHVNIRFLDIATDGYTQVGSVTLPVELP